MLNAFLMPVFTVQQVWISHSTWYKLTLCCLGKMHLSRQRKLYQFSLIKQTIYTMILLRKVRNFFTSIKHGGKNSFISCHKRSQSQIYSSFRLLMALNTTSRNITFFWGEIIILNTLIFEFSRERLCWNILPSRPSKSSSTIFSIDQFCYEKWDS